jgi:hypothetical protein
MEGSDYCVTVEDAVVVLELIMDDVSPEGSDRPMDVDDQSSMKILAKETAIINDMESNDPFRLSELANESASNNAPSSSVNRPATSNNSPSSVVDVMDAISRTLAGR